MFGIKLEYNWAIPWPCSMVGGLQAAQLNSKNFIVIL